MASSHPTSTVKNPPPPPPHGGGRRGLILHRRRKLPVVRLGSGRPRSRKAFSLRRMLRRVRLRWLKLRYGQFFKKLKEYYKGLVKDIIDAGATIEAYQQRMLMETSLAVPMGVSFSTFPMAAAGRSDLYHLPRYGGGLSF